MKQRYVTPATNIVQMYELHYPVLGSEVKFKNLTVDDLTESYYSVSEGEGGTLTESNPDYLIKF